MTWPRSRRRRPAGAAGLLGGAGVTGHLALLFVPPALMFTLDSWMHGWAALIVAVLRPIVAAVLAARGLKEVNPPLENTQRTLKEGVRWAKEQQSS